MSPKSPSKQKSTSNKKKDVPWMNPTEENKLLWEQRKEYYHQLFKEQRGEKSTKSPGSTKKGGKRRKPRKTKKHRKKKSL